MSDRNYLDELDSLMDNPTELETLASSGNISKAKAERIMEASANTLEYNALEASHTWANVIEQASLALQDGTQTAQEIAQKNLDLAKSQSESIKELVDAASGWRHATRQAVQEVNSAKKNVIILTVISGVIAIAGFGTTIGVMLQSRAGFISMSNSVLENVDEHQSLVSKTLTLKMDELASTIEQMQASLDQLTPNNVKTQSSEQHAIEEKTDSSTTPTEAPVITAATNTMDKPINDTKPVTTATNETVNNNVVNTQVADKLVELQNQLTQLEASFSKNQQEMQQQLGQLPANIDEKISAKLAKATPTVVSQTATPQPTTATIVSHPDNKVVLEQIARLRQDIGEIKSLQTALKEQIIQLKQTNSEAKPYQYRTSPDIETYPR
jgi:TolA-binding protein